MSILGGKDERHSSFIKSIIEDLNLQENGPSRHESTDASKSHQIRIKQTAHGFELGDIVRFDLLLNAWTKSQSDTADHGFIGGMVVRVATVDAFTIATPGSRVKFPSTLGYTVGIWYLSDTVAGTLTSTAPGTAIPVLMVYDDNYGILLPGASASASSSFLQIIQGQEIATGQYAINYSASLTLTQLYDPDVDTTYPSGLGNAWLWTNGARSTGRVLVRHDATDYQFMLLAGVRRRVLGTTTLTVASGIHAGETMTAYRHTWE